LVFSPVPLLAYQPRGGTVYAGRAVSKLEQTERLARHVVNINVPDIQFAPADFFGL
jgi:hypothetical protein